MSDRGKNRDGKSRIQAINEERLLDAAEEVFAEFGFRGATVDQISARAGMSKPNLHYYFKRKKDLYLAVLRRTVDLWTASFQDLNPQADPEVELRRYVGLKLRASQDNPHASRVLANEILQGAPLLRDYLMGDLRAVVQRKCDVIQTWCDAGKLAPVDPYHLIFLIWASTQHYADFAPQLTAVLDKETLSDEDFRRAEEAICMVLFSGILPKKNS